MSAQTIILDERRPYHVVYVKGEVVYPRPLTEEDRRKVDRATIGETIKGRATMPVRRSGR
jgi:hypothetical protein